MAETKYGKYIIRDPVAKMREAQVIHICAEDDCAGAKFPGFPAEYTMVYVKEPVTMNPQPHAHDFAQFLCFFGSNPDNPFDFGAEVEVYLGEEGEKHFFDTPTIVYIPKGLVHCPVDVKNVVKPILFMHICFAPEYTRSVGDMSGHPEHGDYKAYSPEEIKKMKGR